jgi:hypothetical protein
MRRITPPTTFAALTIAVALALGACGSDEATSDTLPEPAAETTDFPATPDDVPDGETIGTANMGGLVIDPKPHAIDGIDIAESYPEQLTVTFTAGDAGCMAADAEAKVVNGEVVVYLNVGITEDALVKTCPAGDVQHQLTIALTEGLDGRPVVQ